MRDGISEVEYVVVFLTKLQYELHVLKQQYAQKPKHNFVLNCVFIENKLK